MLFLFEVISDYIYKYILPQSARRWGSRENNALVKAGAVAEQALYAIKTVVAYGGQAAELKRSVNLQLEEKKVYWFQQCNVCYFAKTKRNKRVEIMTKKSFKLISFLMNDESKSQTNSQHNSEQYVDGHPETTL